MLIVIWVRVVGIWLHGWKTRAGDAFGAPLALWARVLVLYTCHLCKHFHKLTSSLRYTKVVGYLVREIIIQIASTNVRNSKSNLSNYYSHNIPSNSYPLTNITTIDNLMTMINWSQYLMSSTSVKVISNSKNILNHSNNKHAAFFLRTFPFWSIRFLRMFL